MRLGPLRKDCRSLQTLPLKRRKLLISSNWNRRRSIDSQMRPTDQECQLWMKLQKLVTAILQIYHSTSVNRVSVPGGLAMSIKVRLSRKLRMNTKKKTTIMATTTSRSKCSSSSRIENEAGQYLLVE